MTWWNPRRKAADYAAKFFPREHVFVMVLYSKAAKAWGRDRIAQRWYPGTMIIRHPRSRMFTLMVPSAAKEDVTRLTADATFHELTKGPMRPRRRARHP